MRSLLKGVSVCLLVLAIGALIPAVLAQSDSAVKSDQSSGEKTLVAAGELQSVDTSNQTFTIKDTNGEAMQFQYNSGTQVEGSKEGVQGLSSETGTRVTVHYQEKSGQRMATKIVINKDKPNR